mmetsp:Transcript_46794/g.105858  ORF Transcript_46794/g.105858 Transcript_46794/m.105858 type:complete len:229 (-) Transcript_46794:265-951(-)
MLRQGRVRGQDRPIRQILDRAHGEGRGGVALRVVVAHSIIEEQGVDAVGAPAFEVRKAHGLFDDVITRPNAAALGRLVLCVDIFVADAAHEGSGRTVDAALRTRLNARARIPANDLAIHMPYLLPLAVLGDSAEFDEIAKIAPKERVLEATVNLEKRFPERVHECSIDLGCVEHARVDGLGPHLLEQSLGGIEAPLRAQERAKDKEQEKSELAATSVRQLVALKCILL